MDVMENMCLADFAAKYRYAKSRKITNIVASDVEENGLEEEPLETNVYALRNGKGYLFRRTKPMLYHPWRDELADLIENNNEEACGVYKENIERNRRRFNVFDENELEMVLLNIQNTTEDANEIPENSNLENIFRPFGMAEIDSQINILAIPIPEQDDNQVQKKPWGMMCGS